MCPSHLPTQNPACLHEFQKRELGRREVLLAVSSVPPRPRGLTRAASIPARARTSDRTPLIRMEIMNQDLLQKLAILLICLLVPGGLAVGASWAFRRRFRKPAEAALVVAS